jgi:hypothetical protein
MIRRLAPSHQIRLLAPVFLLPVLALLALLTLSEPAHAIEPIDDFEVGPFAFESVGAYQEHVVTIPDFAGHVITPQRGVVLEPADGSAQVNMQLTVGAGDDAVLVNLDDGSRTRLAYEFAAAPRDLTAGGIYDRIEVDYDYVTPGSYFSLGIGNGSTFCGNERFPAGNPGVVVWPLDYCADFVPPTEVTGLILYCRAFGGDAEFEVSSIRLMRAGAFVPQIVRDFVAIEVPPLPAPPIPWTLLDESGQPLFDARLVLTDARADDGSIPALVLASVAEPFHAGSRVRSSISWQDPASAPLVARFGLTIDLASTGSGSPSFTTDLDQDTNPADVTFLATVELQDGGSLLGDTAVRLGLAVPSEQPSILTDVEASITAAQDLVIEIELASDGTSAPEAPLLEIVWESDWRAETVTGVTSPVVVGPSVRTLTAAPNVTTSSTTLRSSQPFATGATVRIYDVAGRLVREFTPAAGSQSLVWDGRDRGGLATASGTYFARWRGPGGETATARVVRVR